MHTENNDRMVSKDRQSSNSGHQPPRAAQHTSRRTEQNREREELSNACHWCISLLQSPFSRHWATITNSVHRSRQILFGPRLRDRIRAFGKGSSGSPSKREERFRSMLWWRQRKVGCKSSVKPSPFHLSVERERERGSFSSVCSKNGAKIRCHMSFKDDESFLLLLRCRDECKRCGSHWWVKKLLWRKCCSPVCLFRESVCEGREVVESVVACVDQWLSGREWTSVSWGNVLGHWCWSSVCCSSSLASSEEMECGRGTKTIPFDHRLERRNEDRRTSSSRRRIDFSRGTSQWKDTFRWFRSFVSSSELCFCSLSRERRISSSIDGKINNSSHGNRKEVSSTSLWICDIDLRSHRLLAEEHGLSTIEVSDPSLGESLSWILGLSLGGQRSVVVQQLLVVDQRMARSFGGEKDSFPSKSRRIEWIRRSFDSSSTSSRKSFSLWISSSHGRGATDLRHSHPRSTGTRDGQRTTSTSCGTLSSGHSTLGWRRRRRRDERGRSWTKRSERTLVVNIRRFGSLHSPTNALSSHRSDRWTFLSNNLSQHSTKETFFFFSFQRIAMKLSLSLSLFQGMTKGRPSACPKLLSEWRSKENVLFPSSVICSNQRKEDCSCCCSVSVIAHSLLFRSRALFTSISLSLRWSEWTSLKRDGRSPSQSVLKMERRDDFLLCLGRILCPSIEPGVNLPRVVLVLYLCFFPFNWSERRENVIRGLVCFPFSLSLSLSRSGLLIAWKRGNCRSSSSWLGGSIAQMTFQRRRFYGQPFEVILPFSLSLEHFFTKEEEEESETAVAVVRLGVSILIEKRGDSRKS